LFSSKNLFAFGDMLNFIKCFFAILALLTAVPFVQAQDSGTNTVDAFVYLDFYHNTGIKNASVEFDGELMLDNKSINLYRIESFSRPLKPGAKYTLKITRHHNDSAYGIGIAVPDGYVPLIDGQVHDGLFFPQANADVKTFTVSIVSASVLDPGGVMEAGASGGVGIGPIGMRIGLGRRSNGAPAGFIEFGAPEVSTGEAVLSPDIFTRKALSIHSPPCNTGEIRIVDDVTGNVAQIKTASCLADLVDNPSGSPRGYEIRFYADGAWDGTANRFVPIGGTLVTYILNEIDGNTFEIIRSDASGSFVSKVSGTRDGNFTDWELLESSGGYIRRTRINNSLVSGKRQEDTETIYTQSPAGLPAAATKALRTRKVYSPKVETGKAQIGERMLSVTTDPDTALAYTNAFRYSTDPTSPAFGLPIFRLSSYGDWNFYVYENVSDPKSPLFDFMKWSAANAVFGSNSAMLPRQRKLFRMFSSAENWGFSDINAVTSTVISNSYFARKALRRTFYNGYGWSELRPKPISTVDELQKGNEVTDVGGSSSVPLLLPAGGTKTTGWTDYIELTRNFTPGFNANARSYTAVNVPPRNSVGYDYRKAFKPYLSVSPDNVKTGYGYAGVASYSGVTNAWLEIEVTGKQDKEMLDRSQGDFVVRIKSSNLTNPNFYPGGLSIAYAGRLIDSYGAVTERDDIYAVAQGLYTKLTQYSHEGVNYLMDEVKLVPGKSTKNVRVLNDRGESVRTERWFYTTGAEWKLADYTVITRDAFGRATSSVHVDGASGSQRDIYTAAYTGRRVAWQKDHSGTREDFGYDGLDRVISVTTTADHNTGLMPEEIVVTTQYDVAGRVVESSRGGVTESCEFDTAGNRLWSEDKNGLRTTYAYAQDPDAGKRVTTTFPGGATRIQVSSKGGRSYSITGTAQIPSYFQHGYEAYNSWTGSHFGLPAGDKRPHPWIREVHDRMGHPVLREMPGANSSGLVKQIFEYDLSTARLSNAKETQASGNGTIIRWVGYDEVGTPNMSGVDVDGGGIADASNDVLSKTNSHFVFENGALFQKTISNVFPVTGSPAVVTRTTLQRLNGFNASTIYEQVITDIRANTITHKITVHPNRGRTVTQAISSVDGTTWSEEALGSTFSNTDARGARRTSAFDAAGRITESKVFAGNGDLRSKESYQYAIGKYRLERKQSYVGNNGMLVTGEQLNIEYDTAGRVCRTSDSSGARDMRTAYNLRNQVVKKWGAAADPEWFVYEETFGRLIEHHRWSDLAAGVDLGPLASPPPGSQILRFERNATSGLVSKRTEGESGGLTYKREATFTYDIRGQLLTESSPSYVASLHTQATPSLTTNYGYDPKTGRLLKVDYSDTTPDLNVGWTRDGRIASVVEGASKRVFNYDPAVSGSNALQVLSEDLPDYYSTIPSRAANDSLNTATRITRSYTTTGHLGVPKRTSLGVGNASSFGSLTAVRQQSELEWSGPLVDALNADDSLVEYDYVPNTGLVSERKVAALGFLETRGYDLATGKLSNIDFSKTNGVGAATLARHEYIYDGFGRIDKVTQTGSNYTLYGASLHSSLGYDAKGRLEAFRVARDSPIGSTVPARDWSYAYDTNGNRMSETRLDAPTAQQTTAFNFDSLNRISSLTNPRWSEISGWDNFATTYTFSGTDSVTAARSNKYYHSYLTKAGTTWAQASATASSISGSTTASNSLSATAIWRPITETLLYDARGNLAQDATWKYAWDARNQLISMEPVSGTMGTNPDYKYTFKYDWMGRRYAKQKHSKSGTTFAANPQQVTLFWWDGWQLMREATYEIASWSNGVPAGVFFLHELKYYWGPDVSGSVGGANGTGGLACVRLRMPGKNTDESPFFPAYDGSGNLIALRQNGPAGSITEYDPYGRRIRDSRSGLQIPFMTSSGQKIADVANAFGFGTRYTDAETGLVYFLGRYYSPRSGRFLNCDPIAEAGGANLYAYCHGDPVNKVDMLGMKERVINGSAPVFRQHISNPDVIYMGFPLEEDGWFSGFSPNGNYVFAPTQISRSSYQRYYGTEKKINGMREIAQAQLQLNHTTAQAFYLQNSLELVGGMSEMAGGIILAPESAGASIVFFAHGSDVTYTRIQRLTAGPRSDIQSVTSQILQTIPGVDRHEAEMADGLLSMASGATTLYHVGKGPLMLSPQLVTAGREEVRTFYTVQGPDDAVRLLSGGEPWPLDPHRAHLGPGLYTWDNLEDASKYLAYRSDDFSNLRIMTATIPESNYQSLRTLDMRGMAVERIDEFMDSHSLIFGEGRPHGYEQIIRPVYSDRYPGAYEFHFDSSTFHNFDIW
jgi:RHS repeat-associated protein